MLPKKSLRPCKKIGCNNLTRETYCKEHAFVKQSNRSSTAMGYGRAWQKARKSYLEMNPFCACGCGRLAEVVDHKIPHKGDVTLFWDRDNWQGLTVACHNRKTAREDMGSWSGKLK